MLQQFNSKNEHIYIGINGELFPRKEARISVFDSVVQGGDAVWEGIRIYEGYAFMLQEHIERLLESAKSLAFSSIPAEEYIRNAIFKTLEANGMRDETHIRLTLTRGDKITSGMDPRLNTSGCTLIVLAEWKPPVYDNQQGIRLVTSAIRRNNPQFLDSHIHHNNLLNNILAKIEANYVGADDAIMLDNNGFVAETNATNLFLAKKGRLFTPFTHACLPGITRGLVTKLAKSLGIPVEEKDLTLSEFYNADEVFTTGTMGELTPVREIDGRKIENRPDSKVLLKIEQEFRKNIPKYSTPLPF